MSVGKAETLVDIDLEDVSPSLSKLFTHKQDFITSPNKKAMEATLKMFKLHSAVLTSSFEETKGLENIKVTDNISSSTFERTINGPVVEEEQLKKVRNA